MSDTTERPGAPRPILPGCLIEALAPFAADDPGWVAEMTRRYLDADEDSRADIEAFLASGGPRMVDEARAKHEDGTPTSADLEGWT